jgi:hypothetical protein
MTIGGEIGNAERVGACDLGGANPQKNALAGRAVFGPGWPF